MSESSRMTEMNTRKCESIITFKNGLFDLGRIAVGLARVDRSTRLPDGKHETDVEHSFHLSLTVAEIVAYLYPELDPGKAAMYANVHELPELHSGDVSTFNITPEERAAKEASEKASALRLYDELPPYTARLLHEYEEQRIREARLVRLVDKSLPAIINTVAADKSTFMSDYNVFDVETLREHRRRHTERLCEMFPDFPEYFELRTYISEHMQEHFFPGSVIQSEQ